MTIMSVDLIMKRISAASDLSRIAVFKTPKGLDAVFDSTVMTRAQIKTDANYLGSFSRSMDRDVIRELLGVN